LVIIGARIIVIAEFFIGLMHTTLDEVTAVIGTQRPIVTRIINGAITAPLLRITRIQGTTQTVFA
tara:strand:- start:160 stop:354 length:195 start_codon:yes stop_codon:yes gene_type:complete